jgi:hypothetical protein
MAREDFSERGLPSAEVRRQILQRAGTILDEARDLMALLDRYEPSFSRNVIENRQFQDKFGTPLNHAAVGNIAPINRPTDHVLAA